jgi:site-specific recombinase XerD
MLGLLGLRIFEATGADITDLGEHCYRVLRARQRDQGSPDPAATGGRAGHRPHNRRLRHLARTAGVQFTRAHPHMLRHSFVTTMLDAGWT